MIDSALAFHRVSEGFGRLAGTAEGIEGGGEENDFWAKIPKLF